ncbi:transcriptional regulator [Vibrio ulleungensis]|jgi:hypothetical protein|uniref:Transcriptional regulator n=1 Tax=Vibrio ulleungensis TaxID=2807619 RepID=A0ABS2HBF1_9VIBR|nr:transcriptional regulator [Vibrio ulleungensis]MBM7034933.1 transcriptional regulator [Vibrio ulleungensis]
MISKPSLNKELWQEAVSNWYQSRKHDQVEDLLPLLQSPPNEIWGPALSSFQQKGLTCWLDGCLRAHQHFSSTGHPDDSYQYLNFAIAKLQQVASDSDVDIEIKTWCVQRLDQLIILALEFCSEQGDEWKQEQFDQIEAHVKFMTRYPYKQKNGEV